jgi:hypothetical protein
MVSGILIARTSASGIEHCIISISKLSSSSAPPVHAFNPILALGGRGT